MHESSLVRMRWFVENYLNPLNEVSLKILDVGSYDVNGSYRHLFSNPKFSYLGVDMASGPNVDIVLGSPYIWKELETDAFDVIISGQTFEHMEFFWIAMGEMTRVLKKGGLLCIIVPNGFREHRYPVDCYRFFTDGMIAMARYVNLETLHAHTNCAPGIKFKSWYSQKDADSMLVARKNYSGPAKYIDLNSYHCIPPDHEQLRAGLVAYQSPYERIKSFVKSVFPSQ